MERERVVFLDWLRVVACFMVMAIHSAEPFYLGGTEPNITHIASRWDMLWITVTECICRIAVPLFVMTSSYLLFPVRRPTGEFFKRRLGGFGSGVCRAFLGRIILVDGCDDGLFAGDDDLDVEAGHEFEVVNGEHVGRIAHGDHQGLSHAVDRQTAVLDGFVPRDQLEQLGIDGLNFFDMDGRNAELTA